MNDHPISAHHSTYVRTSVATFSVLNKNTIFCHLSASQREGCLGRSGPFNLRGGVTYDVTLQFCFFGQKASHLIRRRPEEPWRTCSLNKHTI